MAHGIGTWSMHYTGVLAFRLPVPVQYDWPTVLLSLLVSIMGSAVALSVVSRSTIRWPRALAGSIFLGGIGITGLHHTAMAAVRYTLSSQIPDLSHAVSIWSLGVLGISIVPVMVLVVALLTTLVDRLQQQSALLDELFEQASQVVALMDADHRVVRVNLEFTRLFGYTPRETIGRPLRELIVPDKSRAEEQRYGTWWSRGSVWRWRACTSARMAVGCTCRSSMCTSRCLADKLRSKASTGTLPNASGPRNCGKPFRSDYSSRKMRSGAAFGEEDRDGKTDSGRRASVGWDVPRAPTALLI